MKTGKVSLKYLLVVLISDIFNNFSETEIISWGESGVLIIGSDFDFFHLQCAIDFWIQELRFFNVNYLVVLMKVI